jgi:hypothetical protein
VTGYATCYDEDGEIAAGATVTLRFDSITGDTGKAFNTAERTATSDINGLAQFTNLMPGATYVVKYGIGEEKTITIASDATSPAELGSFWGVAS